MPDSPRAPPSNGVADRFWPGSGADDSLPARPSPPATVPRQVAEHDVSAAASASMSPEPGATLGAAARPARQAKARANTPPANTSDAARAEGSPPVEFPSDALLDRLAVELAVTTPTGLDPGPVAPSVPPPTSPPPRPSLRSLEGQRFGRYEILEEVGHGGMATVYRGHDPRLGRDVALKVIHHHLRDNPEIAERFRHEARAVAKLKHPSIVEIFDVPDSEDGERFLVAELVDGPSLRRLLQDQAARAPSSAHGPAMPPEIAAALVLQVLGALSRAHAEGIVHRDVKPENILIAGLPTRSGARRPSDAGKSAPRAKLTDFGIAKILDAQGMTSTGQILGSPAHMAPEQIEGGEVTPRVDIFATGVLFYELLTGALPFDGKNPAQVIRRVLEGEFVAPDRIAPAVGGRWAAIVSHMLMRDPEQRPATVDDVAAEIRAELDALAFTDPDKELQAFLCEPAQVWSEWAGRIKPRLVERARRARDAGDVVGAAHDMNRALAYDPSDSKLVHALGALRARERRLRRIRTLAPPVALTLLLAGAGYAAVHRRVTPKPPHGGSGSATPSGTARGSGVRDPATSGAPTSSATAPGATSASPSPSPSTVGVGDASVGRTPDAGASRPVVSGPPLVSSTTKDPAGRDTGPTARATRRVSFNLYPPGKFTVDGEGPFDPLEFGERDLAVGDHRVVASGNSSCCEGFDQILAVEPGDGKKVVSIRFTLRPAKIFLPGRAGAVVTVKSRSGGVIAHGEAHGEPPSMTVPMSATSLDVSVHIEGPGFPSKTQPCTLRPGDGCYIDL